MRSDVFLHVPKTAGTTLSRIVQNEYPKRETLWFRSPSEVEKYEKLPIENKERLRLLRGHIWFHIDEFIPSNFETRFFTVLRNPVDRLVSLYSHLKRDDQVKFHAEVSAVSFSEFATGDLITRLNNQITRILSGRQNDTSPCNEDDLQAAIANLRSKIFFGVMEQFDESILLLKYQMK